jgi:hypothetical protein
VLFFLGRNLCGREGRSHGHFRLRLPGGAHAAARHDHEGDLNLSAADLSRIAATMPKEAVAGERYSPESFRLVDR